MPTLNNATSTSVAPSKSLDSNGYVKGPRGPDGARDGIIRGPRLRGLSVPSAIVGGTLGLVWMISGLSSCDSTARFGVADTKFERVQVVSVFPARIDKAKGTVKRVCGAPLEGETAVAPNGFEFTLNLVSNDLAAISPKCVGDKDLGVRDGERVEQQLVTTDPNYGQSVAPQMFKLQSKCIEPRAGVGDPNLCGSSMSNVTSTASVVSYRRNAMRCDPDKTDTWQNVAILVDHSGSTSGQVVIDTASCLDATKFAEDLPNTKAPEKFGSCMSDKYYIRVQAAQLLIDQLNAKDRVMTMLFDEENGVKHGCTDSARCVRDNGSGGYEIQPGKDAFNCLKDEDCNTKDANPYHCDSTLSNGVPDGYDLKDPAQARKDCFGNSAKVKSHNRYGIDARARYNGVGRAPLFEAVSTAFDFLQKNVSAPAAGDRGGNAKHIVLITDGPDTCTRSENFHFSDPKAEFGGKVGDCRSLCTTANTTYKDLLAAMAQAKFPVKIHVIQMQSKGSGEPDPVLMELACRSEGTFQYLNQVEFVQDDPDQFYTAIGSAVSYVRNALGGTWRVGVLDNRIDLNDKQAPMPVGSIMAMRGEMRFDNPLFASLAASFSPPQGTAQWDPDFQFQQAGKNALRDRRLMFHIGCTSNADCGGSDDGCAINHCAMGGVCRTTAAPDLLRCGDDDSKFCCKGKCSATCDGVCKK